MKQCYKCKEFKELTEFWKTSKSSDRLQHYCKKCQNDRKRIDYKTTGRDGNYRRHFNITLKEFNTMLEKQDNKCAICLTQENEGNKNFVVDHDYITNKVRGLLCDRCNRGLGTFKDSIDILNKAINYLKENN